MAKDPAFLFYPGDWYLGTMTYSLELKGAYMELLILQFQQGGFTEAHAQHMLGICFSTAWPILQSKFKFDGALYYNERLKYEIEKRSKYSESRRNNANSAKKEKKEPQAYAKHMHTHMGDHMENENDNRNINSNNKTNLDERGETPRTRTKNPEAFDLPLPFSSEEFKNAWLSWFDYRRKARKPMTDESLKRTITWISERTEGQVIAAINHSIRNSYQGLFEDKEYNNKHNLKTQTDVRIEKNGRVEPRGGEFGEW